MTETIKQENVTTSLVRQARMAYDIVEAVYNHVGECWDALSMREIFDAQEIILTGCGDSYCAAIATKPLFEQMCRVPVRAMRCIEVSRNMDKRAFGYANGTPLVIAISVTGSVSRGVEALQRANKYGANTLAVTDNPNSPLGKAAKHIVHIGLPAGVEYGPGANSYNGSLLGLMALALRMGRVKNNISEETLFAMRNSILDYAKACQKQMNRIGQQAFDIAVRWHTLKAIDFIGDYGDYSTAFFGSAKVLETFGGYTTYDDSEDWCHINFFIKDSRNIGRVVVANGNTPSYNRLKETMWAIDQLQSPCMVVTDMPAEEFPKGFDVVTFPQAPYSWLNPLMQHFAFDMVAGYIEAIENIPQFRGDMAEFHRENTADEFRIRSSSIELN